eukprot:SAG31_NODE_2747_length_5147_cov_3.881933_7_plen_212_part_00
MQVLTCFGYLLLQCSPFSGRKKKKVTKPSPAASNPAGTPEIAKIPTRLAPVTDAAAAPVEKNGNRKLPHATSVERPWIYKCTTDLIVRSADGVSTIPLKSGWQIKLVKRVLPDDERKYVTRLKNKNGKVVDCFLSLDDYATLEMLKYDEVLRDRTKKKSGWVSANCIGCTELRFCRPKRQGFLMREQQLLCCESDCKATSNKQQRVTKWRS